MDTQEKLLRKATKALPAQWLLLHKGEEVGLIERWKPTATSPNPPWQAYFGIGFASKLVGSFYGSDGRQKAKEAILKANG